MKKSKKILLKQNSKNSKNKKEMFTENPFFLAILVFFGAMTINYLLETDFIKNLCNWTGYYFNLTFYQINSAVQLTFKNHPFIKPPLLQSPLTPAFMAAINPWMYLRGFAISAFITGLFITLLQIKIIKSKNIIKASVLAGIGQFVMYAAPHSVLFSPVFFMILIQKFYINIFFLMFVSFAGMIAGLEYALYLFRNEKVSVSGKHNVKVIDSRNYRL